MKLLEYQAKELFKSCGIPLMPGVVLSSEQGAAASIKEAGLSYPVAIKVQVPIGGRGKAGGIRFAKTPDEAEKIAGELLQTNIRGYIPEKLLAEEMAKVERECYLSVILDRKSKKPMLMFSSEGGVDIEQTAKTAPEKIVKCVIDPATGIKKYTALYILKKAGMDSSLLPAFQDVASRLYNVFTGYNCMLAEINPLILNDKGGFIALDGKVDADDSALYLHSELMEYKRTSKDIDHPLVSEAESFGFLYIPVKDKGNTVVMSNGSGMLMSCVDRIADAGVDVSAALDLGGGATAERVKDAVRILLKTPGTELLFLSIFGGITRCDEIARGVSECYLENGCTAEIIVRIEGTNRQKGVDILNGVPTKISIVEWPEQGVELLSEGR